MAYTFRDYQNALSERDSYDMGSSAWSLSQIKVESIVEDLMEQRDSRMAHELEDEIYSIYEMLDHTPDLNETQEMRNALKADIEKDMNLLRKNGFDDIADGIAEEMEEE